MAIKSLAEIKVSQITQVGIVVKDVEKVAENYWNILGIGPWTINTYRPPQLWDRRYQGKPAYYAVKCGFAKVGSVVLELLQTVEGHTVCDDFIAKHGEGANHLQYLIDTAEEYNRHFEIMFRNGMSPLMNGRHGDDGYYAYFDTVNPLGTYWEVVKETSNFTGPSITIPADPSEVSPAKIKVKEIAQISLAVRNLEQTMTNYWNILGIGPWTILDCRYPSWHDSTYYGKPANYTMRAAFTMLGPVEFELIEPGKGETVYYDYISQHGEGINHLAFKPDNADEARQILEIEGFPSIQNGKVTSGGGYDYFDTRGPLKILWETFQPPSEFPIAGHYPE